jgi:hypothetical protein
VYWDSVLTLTSGSLVARAQSCQDHRALTVSSDSCSTEVTGTILCDRRILSDWIPRHPTGDYGRNHMAAGPLPLTEQIQSVDTSIGKLSFELGLPTEDTVTKLFDSLDFQRACQAYIWALPLLGFATFNGFFSKRYTETKAETKAVKAVTDRTYPMNLYLKAS